MHYKCFGKIRNIVLPNPSQSSSNKVLQQALFMKQNLRFVLVWDGWAGLSLLNFYILLFMINSSRPPANLKGKGNPDLPSVCSIYWPPNVAQFVFGTFFPEIS